MDKLRTVQSDQDFFTLLLEDVEKEAKPGLELSDILYLRDVTQRKIRVNYGICAESVEDDIQWIMRYNADDDAKGIDVADRQPIKLYLSSPGGSVFDGMRLIDAITCSKTPIWTIVTGYAYSMACEIAVMDHKRFAMANATYLIHEGEVGVSDSTNKTKDFVAFYDRFRAESRRLIVNHTKISAEKLNKMERTEWYITAKEALELGMVDVIITPEAGNMNLIV